MSVTTTTATTSTLAAVTLPPNTTAIAYLKSLEDATAMDLLPTLILLGFLSLVGNMGNGVTLFVYYTRFKPSSTRTFILAMSAFDILFDTFSMPGEIIDLRFSMTFRARWLCRLHRLITGFLTVVSACILVAVAIDRRRKICKPFRPPSTTRQVTVTLVICSAVAFALAIPFSVMNGTHSVETGIPGVVGAACSVDDQFLDTPFPLIMNAVYLLVFLVSVVIMVMSYVQIGRKVVRHKKKLATHTDQGKGGGTVAALALALTQLDSAGHSADHEDSAALSKGSKDSRHPRESSSKADVESLPRASHSEDVHHRGVNAAGLQSASPGNAADATKPTLGNTGRFSFRRGRRGGGGEGYKNADLSVGGGVDSGVEVDADSSVVEGMKREDGGETANNAKTFPGKFSFHARRGQIQALHNLKLEMSRGREKHAADVGDEDINDDVFTSPTPVTRSPGFGSFRRSDSRRTRKVHDEFEMAFKTLAHAVSEDTLRSHSDPGQQSGDSGNHNSKGVTRSRSASMGDELFHVKYIAEFVHQNSKTEHVANNSSSRDPHGDDANTSPGKETARDFTPTKKAVAAGAANGDVLVHKSRNNNLDETTSSESKRRSRSLPGDFSAKVSRGGSAKEKITTRPKAMSMSSTPVPQEGRFRSFVRSTLRRAMTLTSEAEESSGNEPGVTLTLSRRRRTVRKVPSRTTWMMFVLTAIFVLSYLPYLTLVCVRAIHHDIETGLTGWKLNLYTIALKCYFINSVVNPIVYSFCSARFRHQCRYIFRSKRKFSVSG